MSASNQQDDDRRDTTLGEIAARFLCIETLEPRHRDQLDFHEVSCWSVKAALKAAFEAGSESTKGQAAMEDRAEG